MTGLQKFGMVLTIVCSILIIGRITTRVIAKYNYSKDIESQWELADKCSTIADKAVYMDNFVTALDNAGLDGQFNAIFLKTPSNSFDLNYKAVKSLQTRLKEISKMDITSFEYQTAIQQITQQEQGEACGMLKVFKGVYIKEHYPLLWNWVGITTGILLLILLFVGIFFWSEGEVCNL